MSRFVEPSSVQGTGTDILQLNLTRLHLRPVTIKNFASPLKVISVPTLRDQCWSPRGGNGRGRTSWGARRSGREVSHPLPSDPGRVVSRTTSPCVYRPRSCSVGVVSFRSGPRRSPDSYSRGQGRNGERLTPKNWRDWKMCHTNYYWRYDGSVSQKFYIFPLVYIFTNRFATFRKCTFNVLE